MGKGERERARARCVADLAGVDALAAEQRLLPRASDVHDGRSPARHAPHQNRPPAASNLISPIAAAAAVVAVVAVAAVAAVAATGALSEVGAAEVGPVGVEVRQARRHHARHRRLVV